MASGDAYPGNGIGGRRNQPVATSAASPVLPEVVRHRLGGVKHIGSIVHHFFHVRVGVAAQAHRAAVPMASRQTKRGQRLAEIVSAEPG